MGRGRYSWTTIVPLSFVATTTLVAGWQSITDNFWPLAQKQETRTQGWINVVLTAILMIAAVVVLIDSIRCWTSGRKRPEATPESSLAEAGAL
jgi:carbon starvation protein